MPTVQIYFFGLICHLGGGQDRDHAVLIDDGDGHVPSIRFQDTDGKVKRTRITRQANGDAARIKFFFADKTADQPARVTAQGKFDKLVPHLGKLIDQADMKDDIENKTNKKDIVAYVDYPGGELRVHDLYDWKGKYKSEGKDAITQCVARTTVLVVDTHITPLQLRLNGTPVTALTNGCIVIENRSTATIKLGFWRWILSLFFGGHHRHHHDFMSGHFKKHLDLLKNGKPTAVSEVEPCEDESGDGPTACKWVQTRFRKYEKKGFLSSVHIECSNSQYP